MSNHLVHFPHRDRSHRTPFAIKTQTGIKPPDRTLCNDSHIYGVPVTLTLNCTTNTNFAHLLGLRRLLFAHQLMSEPQVPFTACQTGSKAG